MSYKYSKLDEKIDKYLGTSNLRPGPPRRLINKLNTNIIENQESKNIKRTINYSSYPITLNKDNINWEE
jgi:hypothetical protein